MRRRNPVHHLTSRIRRRRYQLFLVVERGGVFEVIGHGLRYRRCNRRARDKTFSANLHVRQPNHERARWMLADLTQLNVPASKLPGHIEFQIPVSAVVYAPQGM